MSNAASDWLEHKVRTYLDPRSSFERGGPDAPPWAHAQVGPVVGWYRNADGAIVFGLDGVGAIAGDDVTSARYRDIAHVETPAPDKFDGRLRLRLVDGSEAIFTITGVSGEGGRFKDLYSVSTFLLGVQAAVARGASTGAQ